MNSGIAPPPRLFGITAEECDVIAIIRRGPSRWFHVGAWNSLSGSYMPGAWFRGLLYPQRYDLSPDGELFCYMALHSSDWPAGDTYIAISKLPWLTALAAWPAVGTWSRGAHFIRDWSVVELGAPIVGNLDGIQRRYGLAENFPHSFAIERRRGWTESPDTPSRLSNDRWDEKRGERITLEKTNPTEPKLALRVQGSYAAFRGGSKRTFCGYELITNGRT